MMHSRKKPPAPPPAYRPQTATQAVHVARPAAPTHSHGPKPAAPAAHHAPQPHCCPRPASPPAPNARPAPRAPNPKAGAVNVPRVLQRKPAAVAAPPQRPSRGPAGAPPPKVNAVQLAPARAPRAASAGRAGGGRVVQAFKLYPNLHPGAVERVEPGSLFRLESFTDQYRLRKEVGHGAYVPNQLYNFVRTSGGEMLLHNRYRHPSIAEGRQVLYAGEAFFNNGRLEWWSNGSGHYQPDSEDATQAALPMSQFFTYQQVIKGEHKRRKS